MLMSFTFTKPVFFFFIGFHLLIIGLNACTIEVLFRKIFPVPDGIRSSGDVLDAFLADFYAGYQACNYFLSSKCCYL